MDSLKGKIALVTGASRGIGRACAVALAAEGARVAVNFRVREDEAKETCRLIEVSGGEAPLFQADVSKLEEVKAMMEKIRSRLGEVSILVNNAGIALKREIEKISEVDWDETVTVNLKSAFLMTRAVLPAMRRARWGRIINVSSNAAFTGGSVGPHYAASKAGMNGLTHGYAPRVAAEGITVNSVAPGQVETDMIIKDMGVIAPKAPVGRFGRVEEVAETVVMLARNGYITGQTILISGGLNMT